VKYLIKNFRSSAQVAGAVIMAPLKSAYVIFIAVNNKEVIMHMCIPQIHPHNMQYKYCKSANPQKPTR